MADIIKTPGFVLGTGKAVLLPCAAGTQVAVTDVLLSNPTASARTVSLWLYNAVQGVELPLLLAYPLLANARPERIPAKLFLQPGDEIRGLADLAGAVTVVLSHAVTDGAAPIASGFVPRGVWSSAATYAINDIATFGGSSYLSRIANNTGFPPDSSSAAWQLLLAQPPAAAITYAAAADIWVGTDVAKAVTAKALADAAKFQPLIDAATIAVDLNQGINFKVTLAGNRTLGAPANIADGDSGIIRVKQDATGSRTLAFNTAWKWPGGTPPTLSTAANAVDRFSYVVVFDTEANALRVECTGLEKGIA